MSKRYYEENFKKQIVKIFNQGNHTYKIMKTEYIYQNEFETLEDLELGLAEFIYWYNNLRIHGSLDYLTPVEYKKLFTSDIKNVA